MNIRQLDGRPIDVKYIIMNFRRIYAIFLRQFYLLQHNPTRAANVFVWIGLEIVLWGFIAKYLNSTQAAALGFIPSLLGAVILWQFLARIQQGVMLAFFEDIWSQNFLNLFASPLKVKEYVGGLILTSILTSMFGLIFMLLIAGLLFGYSIFNLGLYLLPFVFIFYVFGFALGIVAVAFVLRFGPSAEWFAWPIPFLLAPFVGVYYPTSTLPAVLQPISKLIPPSYVFEGMREVLFAGTVSWGNIWFGAALAVAYLVLAYVVFVRVYRTVLREGLIARFSANI